MPTNLADTNVDPDGTKVTYRSTGAPGGSVLPDPPEVLERLCALLVRKVTYWSRIARTQRSAHHGPERLALRSDRSMELGLR
jgi:hypothetical protein